MFAKHGFAGLAIACGCLLVLTVQQARNFAADNTPTKPQSQTSHNLGPVPQDAGERKILDVLGGMESNPALKMMNVDPAEGRLLRVLAESTNAQTVVEVGTSYGYSGLWFCLGLRKTNGKLITHEIDPVRYRHSGENFKQAGAEGMVVQVQGDAHDEVENLKGPIDIVLLDADKEGNLDYLTKLLPKVRPGGLILAHNAVSHKDKMQPYLDAVSSRPDLDTQILNLTGQGMAITLKKR
jgi:caffeoyl-CoA O-methyltransferase